MMIGSSMLVCILVLALCVVGGGSGAVGGAMGGAEGDNTNYAVIKVQPKDSRCKISSIAHRSDHVICDLVDGSAYNGSDCDISGVTDDHYQTYTCIDGTWHHKQAGTDISTAIFRTGFTLVVIS